MADQIGKCDLNNKFLLQNAYSVNAVKKEECQEEDFVDDKVQISETTIVTETQDKLIFDSLMPKEIKQYHVSSSLDNIKTELLIPEMKHTTIQDNIKIEKGINAEDIKIEFDNGFLYCEDCQVYYEDYCAKCGMLVHILNKTVPINADNTYRANLPNNNILEIQDYFGESHVFALKAIPAGVKFGPFTGLNRTEYSWKIKGGKFVLNEDKSKYLDWMQYINATRNVSAQNLHVFQYEDNLYYQSTRQIQEGDELLVYFGEAYEDSLNRNVEMDFIPTAEYIFKDVFACTFCCLGFSSKSYLARHKAICPWNAGGGFSIEELTCCPFCKINLDRKEYTMHHMAYCSEMNDRKCVLPTPGNGAAQVTGRKTRAHQMYKRQQCKYKTKCKEGLKNHTDQHCEVKMYKCGICCRRYKTKTVLRMHVENTHISDDGKDDLKLSSTTYMKVHVKTEHLRSHNEPKHLKCSISEFQTQNKASLKQHTTEKHLKKRYMCDACDYKAIRKSTLKRHVAARHLNEFKYKCDRCDYKANWKRSLEIHIETKHLKEFKYKCETCDYKTNWKYHLKTHTEARHLKEFKYKCDSCDYKVNQEYRLKRHILTKHLKEFKYKCDACDYKTNWKGDLKAHLGTRHLKEFKYKCDRCDYKSNTKTTLQQHVERLHLREFKYKCDECDYKANWKGDLRAHIGRIHLKEFKYKCDTCEYKANRISYLKNHINTIHLKVFKYKCDACDYKTNWKGDLKTHTETKHLNLI